VSDGGGGEETGPWWKSAVVYQIYPRSFLDTDGDGVGDLDGIRRRLDHLEWLGVDTIWLSPIFRSPMADFGYDVSDYCDVDPVFGTLDDFDRLLAEAHARGIRVLLDWVPNHSSDQHPWFVESRSSRSSPKRDWYIWRAGPAPGTPPNIWRAAFRHDEPAWTWDEATQQWYLHLFLPEQPDLNWANPEVVAAMHDTLRFWLDRGVDGFRADVIHGIGKDPALPDDTELAGIPRSGTNDDPRTHVLLRDLRRLLDSYDGDRMMVGEVYLLDTKLVAQYYGAGDELHLAFNFPPLYLPWRAAFWRKAIELCEDVIVPVGWPTWVLSNHDNVRHRTRYGSQARARAAAVLLLTLRGTPFLYAGEELGLEDAEVPASRVVDPGGRDGCRAPIPWDASPAHGWAESPDGPWLPWPPSPETVNLASERDDPSSMVWLYRRLLTARRASPALSVGDFRFVHEEQTDAALAYERSSPSGGDRRVVVVNMDAPPVTVALDGEWTVEVASDGAGEGAPFTGTVPGDVAVVLRPGTP
jgi:alpha-glucosidase